MAIPALMWGLLAVKSIMKGQETKKRRIRENEEQERQAIAWEHQLSAWQQDAEDRKQAEEAKRIKQQEQEAAKTEAVTQRAIERSYGPKLFQTAAGDVVARQEGYAAPGVPEGYKLPPATISIVGGGSTSKQTSKLSPDEKQEMARYLWILDKAPEDKAIAFTENPQAVARFNDLARKAGRQDILEIPEKQKNWFFKLWDSIETKFGEQMQKVKTQITQQKIQEIIAQYPTTDDRARAVAEGKLDMDLAKQIEELLKG